MQLPPYTKTVAGALVLLAAGVALKCGLLTFTDAATLVMTVGLPLMGIGIRAGVEQLRKDFESHAMPSEEPLTKETIQ